MADREDGNIERDVETTEGWRNVEGSETSDPGREALDWFGEGAPPPPPPYARDTSERLPPPASAAELWGPPSARSTRSEPPQDDPVAPMDPPQPAPSRRAGNDDDLPEPQPLPPFTASPTAAPQGDGAPAPAPPYAAPAFDGSQTERGEAPQPAQSGSGLPAEAWAPPVRETPAEPTPPVAEPPTTDLSPPEFEPPVPSGLVSAEPPRDELPRDEPPRDELPRDEPPRDEEVQTVVLRPREEPVRGAPAFDTAVPEPAPKPEPAPEPAPAWPGPTESGPEAEPGAGAPDAYFWAEGPTAGGASRDTGGFARSDSPWPTSSSQLPERPTPTAESLRPETLVRGRRQAPGGGWRRAVYTLTGGLVHPGESAEELRRRDLINRVKTPVAGGHYRLAVLSLKGGVGKTTTTAALGSMLASLRGDRVLAVDANPDRGTLSDKVRLESAASIRDLLNERDSIQRYADFRAYTSQAVSRLEILASDRDPAVSEAFSEKDYREVSRILEHFYSICLTDCGTGLLHSAMAGVLGQADQIVLVSSPSVDGARSASATLDWLEAHQYGDLVRGGLVVLSMVNPKGRGAVDLAQLEEHFRRRCRSVVKIPWDTHLEEGAEIDLDRLAPATRDAYLELAAFVGEAFAWPR